MKNTLRNLWLFLLFLSSVITIFFLITIIISEEIKTAYIKNILVKLNFDHNIILSNLKPEIEVKEVESFYYRLKFTDIDISNLLNEYYSNGLNPSGYIDNFNETILLLNSSGNFFKIDPKKFGENKNLDAVPIDSNLSEILKSQDYQRLDPSINETMGIKDLLVHEGKIFISMVERVFENCFNTAIYVSETNNNILEFKIFFKSNECVLPNTPHAAGGRMKIKDNELFFSHGTFLNYQTYLLTNKKAMKFSTNPAQDKKSIFGKILSININNPDDYRIISIGHRNPQGLFINKDGEIFTSEHGPRGGDSINVLKEKFQNNGWPCKTYGTSYKFGHSYQNKDLAISYIENDIEKSYMKDEKCKNLVKFTTPLFFFSPSIGASEIYQNDKADYPLWNKDLFISSLKDKSLIRLKYEDERVISQEKFKVNSRIRDLLYIDKSIFLLTESPRVALIKIQEK